MAREDRGDLCRGHGSELELTRRFSLRQTNPLALLALRQTGSCEVSFDETLFDVDAPGHYLRRLHEVHVIVPADAHPDPHRRARAQRRARVSGGALRARRSMRGSPMIGSAPVGFVEAQCTGNGFRRSWLSPVEEVATRVVEQAMESNVSQAPIIQLPIGARA